MTAAAVPRWRITLAWLGQILPPLLLLPLFRTPWEIFLFVYWIIGGYASARSVITLIRGRKRGAQALGPVRVRPALTIVIFMSAALYMTHVTSEVRLQADALGRDLARRAQGACERDGVCPEKPQEWIEGWDGRSHSVEFMRVDYIPGEDRRSFSVVVRHRLDDQLTLTGGVDRPLEERLECC